MRKLLISLLVMLLLLPCAGAASLPYPADTVLSVLTLTPAQRNLADLLYESILQGDAHIELPRKTRYDDVPAAMGALMQDYPELFHLGRNYSIGFYRNEPEYATWVEPDYRMDIQSAAAIREQLLAQARLAANFSSDLDVILDVLCQSVSYGGDEELRHTAVGSLLQGAATCEGYSQAVSLICRMKGIPCGVIVGDATDSAGRTDRHSWNIARMNGHTLIDLTWSDQNNLSLNTRWYYGLSTRQMAADHTPDSNQTIPRCGEQDNWHAQRNLVITTESELYAALRTLSREGHINLRFANPTLYARVAHDTFALLEEFNRLCPEDAFYGAYSIVHSDAQMCLILQRAE